MAMNVRVFRLANNFGKRSIILQIRPNVLTKQSPALLSTSSVDKDNAAGTIKKIVPGENFWNKNERMQRPMSPHLTIYKFELPALLSITHRATGLALSGVIAALGVGCLVLPGSPSSYVEMIKALDLPVWFLGSAKALLIWPIVYHTINGVRHLAWDTGSGFEMKTLYTTGYFVVGTSLITAGGILYYLYQ